MATSLLMSSRLSQDSVHTAPSALRGAGSGERWLYEQVGIISNPRSHRNAASAAKSFDDGARHVSPCTLPALQDAIVRFDREKRDLLIVDGGDGTVRDVLSTGCDIWGDNPPNLLIVPSGKTNALANDLGVPRGLRADQAVRFASQGRTERRTPIEVRGEGAGGKVLRGFVFGAGAFLNATALAQSTHRAGAFASLAVGLTLAWSIGRTVWSSQGSTWEKGVEMRISYGADSIPLHGRAPDGPQDAYLLLASTLNRMPLGLRPFGRQRPGLKTLLIDAPPLAIATSVPRLLLGSQAPALEAFGYHRVDTEKVSLDLPAGFVLDGEYYPGGSYVLSRGKPLEFVVP